MQETCRRLLYFTVPRVVAVSPQMRLVEDNPASVSLLDVYKQVRYLVLLKTLRITGLRVKPFKTYNFMKKTINLYFAPSLKMRRWLAITFELQELLFYN